MMPMPTRPPGPRPRRRRRPGGYALIELMVVMTVVAALLILCVGTIHLLLRLDRAGRDAGDDAADLFRLAASFRADAHAAAGPNPPDAGPEGRYGFALGDGRAVEYEVREAELVRTVRRDGRVLGRSQFRRPPRAPVTFGVDRAEGGGSPPFVVLRVGIRPEGQPDGPPRPWPIEAEFARDRRRSGEVR